MKRLWRSLSKLLPLHASNFYGLGQWVYRHRKLAIALWAGLMAVSLMATPYLEQVLQETGAVYEAGSAYQAEQRLRQELNITTDALVLVLQTIHSQKISEKDDPTQQLFSQIRKLSTVSSVMSKLEHPEYISTDSQTQYALIYPISNDSQVTSQAIAQIKHLLHQPSLHRWRSWLTGPTVVNQEIQQISKEDLKHIEQIVLPLTLVVLLVVFGSVIAAVLPVTMAVVAVSVTVGLLYLTSFQLPVSIFALNLTSMLGLGLGIDYSLLIVSRFREEYQSAPLEQAIAHTIETAGQAVFFSGLTVCIGLIGLLGFPLSLLRSLGIAGALVVFVSVATALTLLPALLGICGDRIQQRTILAQFALQRKEHWEQVGQWVVQHCFLSIMIVLVLVGGLTAPFLQARFGLVNADILPHRASARQGTEILKQAFGPGEISPIFVLVKTLSPRDFILSKEHLTPLYKAINQLKTDTRVKRIDSILNVDPSLNLQTYQKLYQDLQTSPPDLMVFMQPNPKHKEFILFKSETATHATAVQDLAKKMRSGKFNQAKTWITSQNSTLIVVTSKTESNRRETQNLVRDLQSWKLDGLEISVTGQTAKELDTIQVINRCLPIVIALMMGITFIILCLLLHSIVLPLKAIVMNVLSLGASFGTLVFIFQDGNLQHWLHFTPVGYLDLLLPVVLFCVLFGLSMDYEVFLLTRIKEAYYNGKSNAESVIEGLTRTGGIITSAALLMILVASAFVMARIIFVKALGLGSAIAVLVDVTLIRVVLVPATMHLLGQWNWWFPFRTTSPDYCKD
jgi:RND superfamily putative drug exporter